MVNIPITQQVDELIRIVRKNNFNDVILNSDPFPDSVSWYLGAGCISQSIWNELHNRSHEQGIKDYDLIYFDPSDISKEAEELTQQKINKQFSHLPIYIEVVNQARVHTWYEQDFGKKIPPLTSCEDAINQWPTTATTIGITSHNGKDAVYAPYGLNDLFGLIVRPNKPHVIRSVYEQKIAKWATTWPNLVVIPWEHI
ncbi:nucleotidyltransferase family protein [candidate division WWE3 bacterium]|nr:nucleotidyltransferase family protein [candidate division WWE3 bacterium]